MIIRPAGTMLNSVADMAMTAEMPTIAMTA